jgi:hypothetical protein
MAFSVNGVYDLPAQATPSSAPGTKITRADHAATMSDFAGAFNEAMLDDGRKSFTAPVGGVAATAGSHLATLAQVQSEASSAAVTAIAAALPFRFWVGVKFDGSAAATAIACTYSVTSNVVTVTKTAHGHRVGHRVLLDGTSGGFTAQSATLTVTAVTTNTFTAALTLANTSGNATLDYRPLYGSINCHSVCDNPAVTGEYYVNYAVDAPNAVNQFVLGSANVTSSSGVARTLNPREQTYTVSSCRVICGDSTSGLFAPTRGTIVVAW